MQPRLSWNLLCCLPGWPQAYTSHASQLLQGLDHHSVQPPPLDSAAVSLESSEVWLGPNSDYTFISVCAVSAPVTRTAEACHDPAPHHQER